MSVSRYLIEGAISDGDAEIDVSEWMWSHVVSIRFYSSSAYTTIVDKADMTGSVTFEASEFGDEYGTIPPNDGVLTLGTTDYDRPNMTGSVKKVKASFTSVTGATHYKIMVASSSE